MTPVVYINLEHRVDRKISIERQFNNYGGLRRLNAVKDTPGYVGCSRSHIQALELAKENRWDHVVILEDDFELLVSIDTFFEKLENLLKEEWDVCLFASFIREIEYRRATHGKVLDGQAASGYIVKSHYYDTLLNNFREGCNALQQGKSYSIYALDQYWKILQKRDTWIVSIPLLGKQQASYSDIEQRSVNYDTAFLQSAINCTLLL